MASQTLVPAVVNGREVYVQADSIVPANQVVLKTEETFGSSVKKGAGLALGVVLVLGVLAAVCRD
jgi:hypothetical protein